MIGDSLDKRDTLEGSLYTGKRIPDMGSIGITIIANSVGPNLWLKIIQMFCTRVTQPKTTIDGFAEAVLKISRMCLSSGWVPSEKHRVATHCYIRSQPYRKETYRYLIVEWGIDVAIGEISCQRNLPNQLYLLEI